MSDGSKTRVFLQPSDEISQLVADLGVDWAELLRQEQIEIQQTLTTDPVQVAGSSEKEPVTVILASAGLIMAIGPALARIITSLSHRPVKVTEIVLVPIEDSKGNVVRDEAGAPVLHWVERSKLLESQNSGTGKSAVSLEGPLGLKLKLDESS
jgi:hypothetical protein